jgi:hypothetical protein
MNRTYLFVPPEESSEVEALGAQWDTITKRWYVGSNEASAKFSRWLPSFEDEDDAENEELLIVSSEAFVAATTLICHRCRATIEVICIHCATGTVSHEPLTRFTVSDIWAMDDALARQLAPWPTFRRARSRQGEIGNFANHCPHCNAVQQDLYLHSEPDHPFFHIPHAPPDSIKLIPLAGTIRLDGSEHFTIE